MSDLPYTTLCQTYHMLDLPYSALHQTCPTPVTYPTLPYTYSTLSSLSVCELSLATTPSASLLNPQVHERFLFRTVPHKHIVMLWLHHHMVVFSLLDGVLSLMCHPVVVALLCGALVMCWCPVIEASLHCVLFSVVVVWWLYAGPWCCCCIVIIWSSHGVVVGHIVVVLSPCCHVVVMLHHHRVVSVW